MVANLLLKHKLYDIIYFDSLINQKLIIIEIEKLSCIGNIYQKKIHNISL